MTNDDSSQSPATAAPYAQGETGSDGDADIPPILFVGLNHEELSWSISDRLVAMEGQVTALTAQVATIDANVRQVKALLAGIGGLLRTPSGISAGNAIQTTLDRVKELHEEEFGPPTF